MENQSKGLDRNQILGFVLIAVIMIGFGWWQGQNTPEVTPEPATDTVSMAAPAVAALEQMNSLDTAVQVADSAAGPVFEETLVTLENPDLRLVFSSEGARIISAQLKEYHTYDDTAKSMPLELITKEQIFDLRVPGDEGLSAKKFIVMRSDARSAVFTDGTTKVSVNLPEAGYDFSYLVEGVAAASGKPELYWERTAMRTEKGMTTERQYSTFSYQVKEDGDVDHLTLRGSDKEDEVEAMNWLAQKQRFFSIIVHPEQGFSGGKLVTVNGGDEDEEVIKEYSANVTLDQTVSGAYTLPFTFYIGPNHYQTLKDYGQSYEKAINFGWGIFGWIGRGVVVPVFNWLEGYGWSYGLIIFVMVLMIKFALSPLTFASYRSMAKMRVLKPQLDEINEKYGEKDQMAKQQAQMSLYREAGVNPLGGCIPVLVQMPILIAMFRFFPASIELRGESFLWATDLSTYDSIISWSTEIPLISTFFGNHLSLFTLLMTASTILYTWMNQQMTPTTGNSDQMKQMRVIMYLMPLMFMFVLNSFPAGLTYYYFVSNIVTFAMQWGIRQTLNDEAILAKIEAKKSQPKKRSRFQDRLEDMQRNQNLNRQQRRRG